MKVDRGGKAPGGSGGAAGSKKSSRETIKGAEFASAIRSAEKRAVEEDLDLLIKQIEEQADVLVRKRTDSELKKYSELVVSFMKRVVGDGYSVSEIPSAHFVENQKVFIIARRVQERLLQLAEQLAARTADASAVAAATSEIRGLLLDMKV